MAKKLNTDFDADGFIEEFRESAVPSYHTANDMEKPDATVMESQNRRRESKPPDVDTSDTDAATQTGLMFDLDDFSDDKKYEALNMTDDEVEYIKAFVATNNFRQVSSKGKQVMIREKYRKIIANIQHFVGDDGNMATYIDNVLTKHFKEYYPIIVGIYKKCPHSSNNQNLVIYDTDTKQILRPAHMQQGLRM